MGSFGELMLEGVHDGGIRDGASSTWKRGGNKEF